MPRLSSEELGRLRDELKTIRQDLHRLTRKEQEVRNQLMEQTEPEGTALAYRPAGPEFVYEVLRAMEADEDYRYETSSPRYDGQHFIATTANINEYQARRFGPIRHDEMRRLFMEFVRLLEERGVDFDYRRTTMRYNYQEGDDADTGFRIKIPTIYLKGGTPFP